MKYVISDQEEVAVGWGYHRDLAKSFLGKVVGAAWYDVDPETNELTVYDGSIGYDMRAKPEDVPILKKFLGII